MCRSIKVLRKPEAEQPATPDEISAAALQFIRKVSGYRKPSKTNQAAFEAAVREVAKTTGHLLETLAPTATVPAPPKRRRTPEPAEQQVVSEA